MAFKGKSIIELTDVNTGEVEVHEDENMVTNALATVFSEFMKGAIYEFCINDASRYSYLGLSAATKFGLFPIYGYGIGGILLFEAPQTEDVNHIYPKSTDSIIGYASNHVNGVQLDTKLGSMDLQNSGPVENGYKFVWDFTTEQANGIISCISLTTAAAGRVGLGNDFYYNADISAIGCSQDRYSALFRFVSDLFHANGTAVSSSTYYNVHSFNRLASICKFDGTYGYACYRIDSNTILVEKLRFQSSILDGNFFNTKDFVNTVYTLEDSFEISFTDTIDVADNIYLYNQVFVPDLENLDIIYYFAQGNSSSSPVRSCIKWFKLDISKKTGEFCGTITIPNKTLDIGSHSFNFSGASSQDQMYYNQDHVNSGVFTSASCNIAVWHNKLLYDTGSSYLYFINLTTGEIEKTYTFSGNDFQSNQASYSNTCHLTYIKSTDCMFTTWGYFDSEENFHRVVSGGGDLTGNYYYFPNMGRRFENNGIVTDFCYKYSSGFGSTTVYIEVLRQLYTPMLHTINNLSSPVQKTVAKTMKITYILTEVNE